MDSSPGFASAAAYFRPIQTRFRYGYNSENLTLACNEQLVGSLNKRHAVTEDTSENISPLPPFVGTWFQVLFHSLLKGSFHLSFTVLVHYRSPRSI